MLLLLLNNISSSSDNNKKRNFKNLSVVFLFFFSVSFQLNLNCKLTLICCCCWACICYYSHCFCCCCCFAKECFCVNTGWCCAAAAATVGDNFCNFCCCIFFYIIQRFLWHFHNFETNSHSLTGHAYLHLFDMYPKSVERRYHNTLPRIIIMGRWVCMYVWVYNPTRQGGNTIKIFSQYFCSA